MPDDRSLDLVLLLRELSVAATETRAAPDRRYVAVAYKGVENFEPRLNAHGIKFEVLGKEELRINLRDLPFPVYQNEEEFCHEALLVDFERDIGILDFLGQGPILWHPSGETDPKGVSDRAFFENLRAYSLLLTSIPKYPEIIAYHDSVRRQFVMLSPEHGRLQVGYPQVAPVLLTPIDLKTTATQFLHLVDGPQSLELRTIFREEAFPILARHDPTSDRIPELARRLDIVLESTLREYDVFIRKISFSTLKSEFRQEREKYFSTLRDVTKNLSTQVLAIPISATAATVALYNIRETRLLVVTIAVVFQIYSLYLIYVLNLVASENRQLSSDVRTDIALISEKSPLIRDTLNLDIQRVEFRTRTLARLLFIVMGAVILVAIGIAIVTGELTRT